MSQGKKLYEDYTSLTKEERKKFKSFLENKEKGDFADLLNEFISKYKQN